MRSTLSGRAEHRLGQGAGYLGVLECSAIHLPPESRDEQDTIRRSERDLTAVVRDGLAKGLVSPATRGRSAAMPRKWV